MKHKLLKLYHGCLYIAEIVLYYVSFPLAFILYKHKHIWLISEINFDARDNGYIFTQFLKNNHPEINCFYIISKKNKNYGNVCDIAKTVEPHSYKHLLLFIAADFKICTLVQGCSHNYYHALFLKKHHGPGKNICLKHGIIKNFHPNYLAENSHLDLLCSGAYDEYLYLKENFNYNNNVPVYTGLARFDNLHNGIKKEFVLIMPTWRKYLAGLSDFEFQNSDFYKKWSSLIKKILVNNEENRTKFIFYLHPQLNKYKHLFISNDNIEYFESNTSMIDIQDCLKNCSMLFTDYSSIFFDVAYMKKPIIFYQFDENEFLLKHYAKGYFDYRKDGFGPVCIDEDECINEFDNLRNDEFRMPDVYLNRSNSFFTICDNNNCDRIYNEIFKLRKKL